MNGLSLWFSGYTKSGAMFYKVLHLFSRASSSRIPIHWLIITWPMALSFIWPSRREVAGRSRRKNPTFRFHLVGFSCPPPTHYPIPRSPPGASGAACTFVSLLTQFGYSNCLIKIHGPLPPTLVRVAGLSEPLCEIPLC